MNVYMDVAKLMPGRLVGEVQQRPPQADEVGQLLLDGFASGVVA